MSLRNAVNLIRFRHIQKHVRNFSRFSCIKKIYKHNYRYHYYYYYYHGHGNGWKYFVGTTSIVGAGSVIEQVDNDKSKKKKKKKNGPSQEDRINGHYQNRIRQLSTPEKIFSTFASNISKKTGQEMMTFNDFTEAILPYDFRNESAALNMKNKKSTDTTENVPNFLKEMIIPNKSHFSINLAEFIFITSLLSIPPSDFEFVFKIFDLDGNGTMDSKEFKSLLEHFKQNNTSNYDITDDNIIRKTHIWKYLFGKNEEKELTLKEFQDILYNLRESILIMEYKRYCGSIKNTLSPKNFAMSLVSYAHHSEVSYYVARVERMPKKIFNQKNIKITWNDFINFNKCLFSINDIMKALKYYEKGNENITQKAFHHTVKCITNIDLNKDLINIMFWVLDRDGDNTLNQKEIQTLLSERFQYGQAQDRLFLGGLLKCFKSCFNQ